MKDSERLARRYFSLFRRGDTAGVLDLVHPDVEVVLKSVRPGEVLRGREQVAEFVDDISGRFYESHADVFRPLDDERIVVEGRMRWMDEQRVLRDDPMVWALEFRDGLLYRSAPAQSIVEAEALLSGSRSG
jgi:ketosteroid isomerase-like protein